jgi:hypothetical protein
VCVCLFVNCRLTYGPRAPAPRLANAEGTAQAIGQRLDTARADAKAQVCVCVCVRERERGEYSPCTCHVAKYFSGLFLYRGGGLARR